MRSASERLRDLLSFFRDGDEYHRGGVAFDRAWAMALKQVNPSEEEREWLRANREIWRRAYEREAPRGADAAILVLAASVLGEGAEPNPEDVCEWCSAPLPEQRHAHKRFCDDECRRKATRQRERERGTRYAAH